MDVPAAVGGEFPDGIDTVGNELPQLLRRSDTTGEPAPHTHNHHRIGRFDNLGNLSR